MTYSLCWLLNSVTIVGSFSEDCLESVQAWGLGIYFTHTQENIFDAKIKCVTMKKVWVAEGPFFTIEEDIYLNGIAMVQLPWLSC